MVRTTSVQEGVRRSALSSAPPDPKKRSPGLAGTKLGAENRATKFGSRENPTTVNQPLQALGVYDGRDAVGLIEQSAAGFLAIRLPDRAVLGEFNTVKAAFAAFRILVRP